MRRNMRNGKTLILCLGRASERLLRAMREKAGCCVLIADSAVRALEIAKCYRLDAAVIDYDLRDMKWFAVAGLLRSIQPDLHVVVLGVRQSKPLRQFRALDGVVLKAISVARFLKQRARNMTLRNHA